MDGRIRGSALEEVKKKERSSSSERNFFTSENIKECTNLWGYSRKKAYNGKNKTQVGYASAHRWLEFYKRTKLFYSPKKRGAGAHLTAAQEEEVLSSFRKIRGKSEHCDSQLICSIARGIVPKQKLTSTLADEGGTDVYTDYWGLSSSPQCRRLCTNDKPKRK